MILNCNRRGCVSEIIWKSLIVQFLVGQTAAIVSYMSLRAISAVVRRVCWFFTIEGTMRIALSGTEIRSIAVAFSVPELSTYFALHCSFVVVRGFDIFDIVSKRCKCVFNFICICSVMAVSDNDSICTVFF
uniref:Putative secreted protein n=1 Tax=Xenopsylla cheopis TaxID=163159 RepID=A0A6M2E0K3_XENCH